MTSDKEQQRPARKRPSGKTTAKGQGAPGGTAQATAASRAQQRRQLLSWLGIGIAIAIVAVVVLIVLNNRGEDDVAGGPGDPATVVAGQFLDSSVIQNGRVLGSPDAPILVVEYGDYQCPHCTRFQRESMERLIDEYIVTGQIRFEFHEYPVLSQTSDDSFDTNGESFRASEAALCALDQGHYWPYHNALYANSLGISQDSFTPERLKAIAGQVPVLDLTAFSACVDNRVHTETVRQMANAATSAGIGSTPTFVINGRPITGADYDEIAGIIEEQLAGP